MQKYFPFLVLLVFSFTSRAQFTDDFSDGDFKQNPAWEGDTGDFEINATGQLHLVASGADTSVLVTASQRIEQTEWALWVKLSFNTSANNYARVYLSSDNPDLVGPLNGYFLQIGGSDDSISFYRQNGTQAEKLLKGNFSCTNHSVNVLRLKMIHDSVGRWTLYSDDTGGTDFIIEGTCIDSGIVSTAWFGIYCHYTKSNSAKFYFDDFYAGAVRVDTIPPAAESLMIKDSASLLITFSERIETITAQDIHHYYSKINGNPLLAIVDPGQGEKVILTFGQPFPDGISDTLIIKGIKDLSGNIMDEMAVPFSNYKEKARDIIIDEIMADPDPVTGLPESEYVELYNRTRFPINLNGWAFEYGSSVKTFPGVTISPHGYLILTRGIMMNHYGVCIDLFSSYSSLSNEGTMLVLKNAGGKVVHSVGYSIDWYKDPLKETGGWSLEMIDTENPCGCQDNWKASIDVKGGTPGAINSVHALNPDIEQPYMKSSRIVSDSIFEIEFSEPMDSLHLNETNQWSLSLAENTATGVLPIAPEYRFALITFQKPIERKHIYYLSCKNPPFDCTGNLLDTTHLARIGLPDSAFTGDLVINEILVNPAKDGEKFIEIFNRSEKILNLQELALGFYDSLQTEVPDLKTISEVSLISFPGDYSVLTKKPTDIQSRYSCPDPDVFVAMAAMPSIDRDQGFILLARKNNGTLVDRVHYSPGMYSDFLTMTEGISLERLNPFLPSEDFASWHSASEGCGFATPGYRNSEFLQMNSGDETISISPCVFTPDDDGKDDVLLIGFKLDEPGYLVSIAIFNASGNLIRHLTKNRLLSTEDGIIWNGRDEMNQKLPAGIYIVYIELLKPEGNVKQIKRTCVLGRSR
ncbi:MAG: lamin tail domain-containing protein [Bacteroidetes bacterium]|nr:lamin tail domain-containing protein [Bacteroidota bacterium]